jgi:hypothetical protein
MRNNFTRRALLSGAASLSTIPLLDGWNLSSAKAELKMDPALEHRFLLLDDLYKKFAQVDAAGIASTDQLSLWQTLYDHLVGAADTLRFIVTDDMPGRDKAVAFARIHVMPPCERAIMYRLPVETSREFGRVVGRYFSRRNAFILSIAALNPRHDPVEMSRRGIEALREVQQTMPVTRGDRIALRRVIESINNNDVADVAMVRDTMQPHEVTNFRSWAQPCGSFTCELCEAWLGKHEEIA